MSLVEASLSLASETYATVFAVILSAAKDPERFRSTKTARTFQPKTSHTHRHHLKCATIIA